MKTIIQQQGATFGEGSPDGSKKERAVIKVKNRDVYATVSLVSLLGRDENAWFANARIESIASGGFLESFNKETVTEIFRKDVTEVTFLIEVLNCNAAARWQLNHWSKG